LYAIAKKEPFIDEIEPLTQQFPFTKIFYATLLLPDSAFSPLMGKVKEASYENSFNYSP